MQNKPTKIFITHSAKDKDYVLNLTELLRSLKVPNDCIVCTSDYRHRIPNGENAYSWLRKQFIESKLHMVFVLSHNYYESNPSLNEMGAAWLVAAKCDVLLLPGFTFGDLQKQKGCLDKDIQGGSFETDDKMLKSWLNNLKNDVIKEFNLEKPDDLDWEEDRNSFIEKMRAILHQNRTDNTDIENDYEHDFGFPEEYSTNPVVKAIADMGGEVRGYEPLSDALGMTVESVRRKIQQAINDGEIVATGSTRNGVFRLRVRPNNPIVGQDDVSFIPSDSALLLVYADAGDGQILKVRTLGSLVEVFTFGKRFMADISHEESARWVEALERLIERGYVKTAGTKGEIYEMTSTGHKKAKWLKEKMDIDTDNEPLDELKKFDE